MATAATVASFLQSNLQKSQDKAQQKQLKKKEAVQRQKASAAKMQSRIKQQGSREVQ